MKIIVIGSLALSLVNFRGDLLKAMVKGGHQVIACAPEIPADVRSQLESFDVRCCNVEISRTGLNPFADIKTLVSLAKLFRKEQPDRVLAYTIKPVLYGSLAAHLTGTKGMYSMITGLGYAFTTQDSIKHRIVARIVNLLYKQAIVVNRCLFFQNPEDLDEFLKRGLVSSKISTKIINGSGVNLQHYALAPLPDTPSFLLIARLIKDKGIKEYVEAASRVREMYPEAKFRLAGWLDSNPSAISRAELETWQSDDIIEYLGSLEDVRQAIAECSVYVLPSYREGTPRTVLEAMAMGRPIITTDTPGCRETVIDGENGFLVQVGSVDSLVGAMERFIENPQLLQEMGSRSREIAESKYDVYKVNAVMLKEMGICNEVIPPEK